MYNDNLDYVFNSLPFSHFVIIHHVHSVCSDHQIPRNKFDTYSGPSTHR